MSTPSTPALWVGGALFLLGGGALVVQFFVGSRMAMGMAGLRNVGQHLRSQPQARRRAVWSAGIAGLGALVAFGAVFAGDVSQQQACRDACAAAGRAPGRFRGNPHVPFTPGDPYACWCHVGDAWAPDPVPISVSGSVSGPAGFHTR